LPKKDVAKRLLSKGWSEILINGRSCLSGACARWTLYPGSVRLTVLSDQWAPQTTILDLAEVDRFSPATQEWAEGGCARNSLAPITEDFPDKKVFWGLACEKSEVTVNIKPLTVSALPLPQAPLPLFTSAAPEPMPIYKSKWFWIGTAVVVAIAVVANSHTKETKEPSTTYGY
jgi:hypothetical protein